MFAVECHLKFLLYHIRIIDSLHTHTSITIFIGFHITHSRECIFTLPVGEQTVNNATANYCFKALHAFITSYLTLKFVSGANKRFFTLHSKSRVPTHEIIFR